MRLSSRCLDVLSLLVESHEPVAAATIARQLNISPRMVRTSLAACEHWLRSREISLKRIPGKGYCLEGTPEARRELADATRDYEHPLTWLSDSSRLHVVLLTLFFAEGTLHVRDLQQVLGVSRTTTLRVLDTTEAWLAGRGLRLVRRQNFGCLIVGHEEDWREAVMSLLRETCGDAWLLALLRGSRTVVDIPNPGTIVFRTLLTRICTALDITLLRQAIRPIHDAFGPKLSDQDYVVLCLYLALVVYRVSHGMGVSVSAGVPSLVAAPDVIVLARQSADRLQALFGIQIPEAEVVAIAQHCPARRVSTAESRPDGRPLSEAGVLRFPAVVEAIVARASLALHPGLRADAEFANNLSAYLASIVEGPPRGNRTGSSVQRGVKSMYPYVYSVARQCSLELANFLGRPSSDVEVGDLAVCLVAAMERLRRVDGPAKRVLIICSEGAVTAWLLVSRLRAEFPDVEVVEVISALEFEGRKRVDGVDFIVTTIPLKARGIPCTQVDPLLRFEDCMRLRALFGGRTDDRPQQGPAQPSLVHLSDLLELGRIQVGISARSWPEVVDVTAQPLLESAAVDRRFVSAMKEVILENGPYMVIWPGVVLLHARPSGVRRLCMSLANLRTPIPFGHADNDPVSIAIVLAAVDNCTHFTALQELNALMQDQTARREIARTAHKSVILRWVSRYSRISLEM